MNDPSQQSGKKAFQSGKKLKLRLCCGASILTNKNISNPK